MSRLVRHGQASASHSCEVHCLFLQLSFGIPNYVFLLLTRVESKDSGASISQEDRTGSSALEQFFHTAGNAEWEEGVLPALGI